MHTHTPLQLHRANPSGEPGVRRTRSPENQEYRRTRSPENQESGEPGVPENQEYRRTRSTGEPGVRRTRSTGEHTCRTYHAGTPSARQARSGRSPRCAWLGTTWADTPGPRSRPARSPPQRAGRPCVRLVRSGGTGPWSGNFFANVCIYQKKVVTLRPLLYCLCYG